MTNPQQSKIHTSFVVFSPSFFFFSFQYTLLISGTTECQRAALTLSLISLWGQPEPQQGRVSSPAPQLLGRRHAQSQISLQICHSTCLSADRVAAEAFPGAAVVAGVQTFICSWLEPTSHCTQGQ